ncbi:MAG: helix-turn-helix domain-containing protein [Kofleriaceae bacterium]
MRPPLVKRADAQRNRATILATAEEMFAADGVAVSVDDIAKQAKVGIGTLYRHFPTKDALVAAIVIARTSVMADHTERALDQKDAGAALFDLIETLAAEGDKKRDLVESLGSTELLMTPELHETRMRFKKALGKLVSHAQDQGAVRAGIQATDITAMLKALFGTEPKSRARLLAIFCDGIRA